MQSNYKLQFFVFKKKDIEIIFQYSNIKKKIHKQIVSISYYKVDAPNNCLTGCYELKIRSRAESYAGRFMTLP